MELISITIPSEIRALLKQEPNQSGLITELLRKHFDKREDVKILKLKKKQLKDNYSSEVKEIDYRIEIVEKETQQVQEEKAHKADVQMMINKQLAKEKRLGLT